ncbi:hypothetical protein MMC30_007281 [Trapelia coarctata]|nr:hypothetical protein [Trapelia coarctata]
MRCMTLDDEDWNSDRHDGCPSLEAPAVGRPVAHVQVVAISKCLKQHPGDSATQGLEASRPASLCHLDTLLRGSRVWVEPPKPKPEPTSEYKALMARLRREEEARAYERMINPPLKAESFSKRFPSSAQPRIFPNDYQPENTEDEEITYADVNRQMALIINILVSIVTCSVAIWMASSHWTTPKRLGLSMGGSGMIGVAEVVVYTGYLRRLKEAKERGKKAVEIKEIIKTWVIGSNESTAEGKPVEPVVTQKKHTSAIRQRKSSEKR